MMNSKTKGFLARVLMFAMLAFLALPTAAFAQDRNNGRWNRNQDQRRRNRNNDRWDNNRNRDWRNDGNRTNDGYGNYGGYRTNDGYGNYGGSFDLRQTALNAGFADGAKEGRKDRSRGDRSDFRDEGNFQSATRDYSSRLGDRELYREYYRQAFEHGYADGYAGY